MENIENYLSQENVNKVNDINDDKKENNKNYINHPRISFTKNTLSTFMDI